MIPISPHFSLEEATHSQTAARLGINNEVPDELLGNLKAAAVGMELVRRELNSNPIIISSWYRCEALNRAVGSKPTSAHLTGYAIDFTCPTAGTPQQIVAALIKSKVPFQQVIWEYASWVHISFNGDDRQALIIDKDGTRVFA
jgi:zinc D-Ala-D-Ala carboxypeptidase